MIAAEFLRQIVDPAIGEFIELRAFAEGKAPYQEFFASPEQAAGQAAAWSNIDGRDVYFGVLPRTRRGGTAADVAPQTDVLWADFDGKNFRGKMGPGSAIAEIANIRLAPQIVVDSGNGYHAYWLLDRPYDFAEAHLGMTAIERAHHSDDCSDAPRILRVPGTFNFKNGESKPVRIVKFDWFPFAIRGPRSTVSTCTVTLAFASMALLRGTARRGRAGPSLVTMLRRSKKGAAIRP